MKQNDKDKAKNPFQLLESEFNKRITGLEGRISQIENALQNRSVRFQDELNHFKEVKEKGRKLEFYFQHSKKVLKGKIGEGFEFLYGDGYKIKIKSIFASNKLLPILSIIFIFL